MPLVPPSAPGAAQRELRPRVFWMMGVAAFGFLVLAVRLYSLQILHGDEYKEKADENFVKELRVPADRGFIMDRNKRILVDERPSYDVVLTPYFCGKQCDEVLGRLTPMLALTPDDVDRARDHLKRARGLERFRPFTVKVDIARDELDVFEANHMDLAGADVIANPHRNYRFGPVGAHLIGYMNEIGPDELDDLNAKLEKIPGAQPYELGDYIGRRGLERRWESELRGVDGKHRVVVDAKGNPKEDADLIPEAQRYEPSTPGHNLVTSIDWRLQEFAERTFPGKAGVVIALDPKTGFILALVDRPSPDPNKLSGRITSKELAAMAADPLQPQLFRAIQQHYHPGSTFKVVTSIAALEEGALKPGSTIFCPGHYTMGGHTWRCDKESGHGSLDLTHALGASCDVFYYTLGDRLGLDKIYKWATLLGLGRPTGLDIAGEIPGVMPDEEWYQKHAGFYTRGLALNVAIGQGDVNVTPLQEVVMYAALANGGTLWKPQVVERIEDDHGNVLKEFAPVVQNKVPFKPETREAVLKGLEAAVNEPYGTAYRSRIKEFEMAGKTGTAQVKSLGAVRLKSWQMEYFDRDHAWFAAFAPVDDPQIVVVVLNEHAGFGASNAAPTAAAMVKYYMDLLKTDELERAGGPGAHPPDAPAPGKPAAVPPPARPPSEDEPKPKLGEEGVRDPGLPARRLG